MSKWHDFKVGDEAWVVNCDASGTFYVEGRACILRLQKEENRYQVQFLRDPDWSACERPLDPRAQEDPEKFVERLNTISAARASPTS
jgi:hypothetical protein